MTPMTATTVSTTPYTPVQDFEVLATLARELAGATTIAALRTALAGRLKDLLPSADIAVLRATYGTWETVVGPEDAPEQVSRYLWTPLTTEGKVTGMLGIGAERPHTISGPLTEAATMLLRMTIQNLLTIETLRQDSVRDGLTGCFTRAHALDVLEGDLRRANRTGFPVSLMMLDVDRFKSINDQYGHVAGDAVLAAVSAQLHKRLRQSDVRCRVGGDEFLVILPDTSLEDALRVAESVRQGIEALPIPSLRGTVSVTASIGVATASCGSTIDVQGFIDRADLALYRAKHEGRNCVASGVAATHRRSTLRLAASKGA